MWVFMIGVMSGCRTQIFLMAEKKLLQILAWKCWSGKSVGSAYRHMPAFHSMWVPPVTERLYRSQERGGRGNGAAADGSEMEGVVGNGTLPFSEAL
ncbi:uncharacterized [Tachysurus ichikawai]